MTATGEADLRALRRRVALDSTAMAVSAMAFGIVYGVAARGAGFPVADVVFTSQSDLKNARAFYDNVKSRLDRFGRTPDDMKVMPGALLFIEIGRAHV